MCDKRQGDRETTKEEGMEGTEVLGKERKGRYEEEQRGRKRGKEQTQMYEVRSDGVKEAGRERKNEEREGGEGENHRKEGLKGRGKSLQKGQMTRKTREAAKKRKEEKKKKG